MVEIYNNNEELYILSCIFLSLILSKHAKTREAEDEHCVLQCPLTSNTLPLDNSKTYSHSALPYITIIQSRSITWIAVQMSKNFIQ